MYFDIENYIEDTIKFTYNNLLVSIIWNIEFWIFVIVSFLLKSALIFFRLLERLSKRLQIYRVDKKICLLIKKFRIVNIFLLAKFLLESI